ncbi:MAG: glycosyltransferase family 4 protein [Solirubrobacteraceae bacterium]|jgi:glycosyltransferase involved in cell wall biosynthesis
MSGKRPRVAMVTDAVAPFNRGGKEERYRELARRLKDDADLHIYTMKWWSGPRTIEIESVPYHALTRLVPLYHGRRRSVLEAVAFALGCMRLLFVPFDVLEADHMPYLQIFVLRAVTWLRRRPLVVTWHEAWDMGQWRRYLGLPGILAWGVERLAMRLPDCILSASEQTTERLRAALGADARIVTAPNAIDLALIERVAPAPTKIDVVSVGRFLSHKRLDLALDAVALLKHRGLAVTCLLVGDGPERESLRAQALALGIDDQVVIRSDISSQEELYGLVKAARCFVFTSEREGFGIAALEAIACGTPVVTTTAHDNHAQFFVRRSARGHVCAPTTEAIAAGISATLDDEARPGAHADESLLAGFDWSVTAAAVLRALEHPRRDGGAVHDEDGKRRSSGAIVDVSPVLRAQTAAADPTLVTTR